jgi:hypothetical protein
MKFDNVTFKQAFLSLGGTYKQTTDRERLLAQSKHSEATSIRSQHKMTKRKLLHELSLSLMICRLADKVYKPMSDEWCEIKNAEPLFLWFFEQKFQDEYEEVTDIDVYRQCKDFTSRFLL